MCPHAARISASLVVIKRTASERFVWAEQFAETEHWGVHVAIAAWGIKQSTQLQGAQEMHIVQRESSISSLDFWMDDGRSQLPELCSWHTQTIWSWWNGYIISLDVIWTLEPDAATWKQRSSNTFCRGPAFWCGTPLPKSLRNLGWRKTSELKKKLCTLAWVVIAMMFLIGSAWSPPFSKIHQAETSEAGHFAAAQWRRCSQKSSKL